MRIIRYLLLPIFCVISFAGYSQTAENIYSLQEEGYIKTKAKFIDALFFDNRKAPSTLIKSYPIASSDGQYKYTVNLSRHTNTKNETGHFHMIDVMKEGKNLLHLEQLKTWGDVAKETKSAASGHFIKVPLRKDATALIFIGYPSENTPTLITIIVLYKDSAALVFNKYCTIDEFVQTSDSFLMKLAAQSIECHPSGKQVLKRRNTGVLRLDYSILSMKENDGATFGFPFTSAITGYGTGIDINSLELGRFYSLDQIKEVLGTPTDISTHYSEDFGNSYEVCWGKDYIRFDDRETGLNTVNLETSKFSLYGGKVRVGDPISQLSSIPGNIQVKKEPGNLFLYFYYDDADAIIVNYDDRGIITSLSCNISL